MSQAFQKASLIRSAGTQPHEQLVLIATLSCMLSQQSVFPGTETVDAEYMLSPDDEVEVLKRVKEYEAGKSKTISGKAFREELRKKYSA